MSFSIYFNDELLEKSFNHHNNEEVLMKLSCSIEKMNVLKAKATNGETCSDMLSFLADIVSEINSTASLITKNHFIYCITDTSVSYNKRLDLFHNTFDSIAVFLN